nr:immunoglobulin heavy chain junction region [Mus musculus]
CARCGYYYGVDYW